jgi:hypothetical protein
MPGHPPDADMDERVHYTYAPRRDDWREWTDTVPRSTPIYARLDTLLRYDREHDLDTLVARDSELEASDDGVAVQMVRIRRRCAAAVQTARQNGADDAADALAEIKHLATGVLESQ